MVQAREVMQSRVNSRNSRRTSPRSAPAADMWAAKTAAPTLVKPIFQLGHHAEIPTASAHRQERSVFSSSALPPSATLAHPSRPHYPPPLACPPSYGFVVIPFVTIVLSAWGL